VLSAGLSGLLGRRLWPGAFADAAKTSAASQQATVIDRMAAAGELEHTKPSRARALGIVLAFAVLWGAPLLALAVCLGHEAIFVREAVFFSKAAVVTFGGAYAVLAYIAQQAVRGLPLAAAGRDARRLGFGRNHAGPLIMVVEFVGFMGAFRNPGALGPLWAGVLGAVVTVWVTFVPCFFWIFLGAPYVEALRGNRWLRAALSAITAAVVGVILNLSVWLGCT